MAKQTMSAAEAQTFLTKKKPGKMQAQGPTNDSDRVKQVEREIKALWNAHSLLQCDINKMKADDD
tara:strand:+ start:102 stop:296 length:195 start_codon:yes stop_codon:yes gene_type:complete